MGKVISRARQIRLAYAVRMERSVTVEEVAEAAGVDRGALTRLETGKTERYDGPMIAKLCAFYGVGVGDILVYVEGESAEKNEAPGLSTLAYAIA